MIPLYSLVIGFVLIIFPREATLDQGKLREKNPENLIDIDTLKERWFRTYLDHYTLFDARTLNLRYYKYFPDNFTVHSPLVIEIGGQNAIQKQSVLTFPSYAFAKMIRGQYIYVEHRFYGRSKPSDWVPLRKTNRPYLRYINVEQVLKDLAYFIDSQKLIYRHTKVFAFGCSYAGTIALWLRYQYRYLVDGAWVSNSPFHAVEELKVISPLYKGVNVATCSVHLPDPYTEDLVLQKDNVTTEEIRDWSCGNVAHMNKENTMYNIHEYLSDHLNHANFSKLSCDHAGMMNDLSDLLVSHWRESRFHEKSPLFHIDSNDYARKFQLCTELSYTIPSAFVEFIYIGDDEFIKFCSTLFPLNLKMDAILFRNIIKKEGYYGDGDLDVSHVISFSSLYDPWYELNLRRYEIDGVLHNRAVKGNSYCADYGESPETEELKEKALKHMAKWL